MDTRLISALGINEKAARIYLSGLALGTTSVQVLARKSNLKRPTVYFHLDELVRRGLFEIVPIDKKTYYRAADPEIIAERIQKNLSAFQQEIPRLSALRVDTLGKPQVRLFEGEEGIQHIYNELRKANNWRFWSNLGEVYGPFHNLYMELCEHAKENGTNVREIIADTKEARRYSRFIAKVIGPTYSARTATTEGLENDTCVYGDTVAFFRLSGLNMFAVKVEDKTITDSMRSMFEMAWRMARPFK